MRVRVVFETKAEAELNEAIAWYDSQKDGLGQRLSSEIRAALLNAASNPKRFPYAGPTTQKIKVLGWPYSIYFTLSETQLIVVSIFHGARNPDNLQGRLK